MYTPSGHPNIYSVGNKFITRIVRNGKKYIQRYLTLSSAIEDYARFVSSLPEGRKYAVVRLTNTDENSPDYLKKYVQLGVNASPQSLSFGGALSADNPQMFSREVIIETPCRLTAKLYRDRDIMANHSAGLSYNRGDLIVSPGVYYICKPLGYVRTLDGGVFRSRDGVERGEAHVNELKKKHCILYNDPQEDKEAKEEENTA